jgi:hypothetical protein
MPDLESTLRAYAVRLDERYPDVTLDELTASPHAERLDGLAGPIDLAGVVSAERARTVKLSEAEPTNGTRSRRRLLIAAAAVVVVIGLIGIALATTNHNDQSPAPVATLSVAPTTTVATETLSFAVKSANDIRVTFTKPKSWGVLDERTAWEFAPPEPPNTEAPPTPPENFGSPRPRVPIGAYSNLTPDGAVVQFASVSNIYSRGCGMTPLDPPVGPTVDDLVTAWANVPELAATTPVDITVDGYTGKKIELTLPDFDYPSCNLGGWFRFGLWYGAEADHGPAPGDTIRAENARPSPNRHFQMLVLDVDGTRFLIAASADPNTPPQDRVALEELLASIQIG